MSKAKHDACIGTLEGVRCGIGLKNSVVFGLTNHA